MTDRPLRSVETVTYYDTWMVKTTHQSRHEAAQPVFKMFRMLQPGQDAAVVVTFTEPQHTENTCFARSLLCNHVLCTRHASTFATICFSPCPCPSVQTVEGDGLQS